MPRAKQQRVDISSQLNTFEQLIQELKGIVKHEERIADIQRQLDEFKKETKASGISVVNFPVVTDLKAHKNGQVVETTTYIPLADRPFDDPSFAEPKQIKRKMSAKVKAQLSKKMKEIWAQKKKAAKKKRKAV